MEIEKTNTPLVDEVLAKKVEALEAIVAELKKKKPEEVYPYPKKAASEMTDAELEAELAKRKKPPYPEVPAKMEADSKVQELEAKLKEYQSKELESRVGSVLDKEVRVGLLESKVSEAGKSRAEELKKLSAESLSAIEVNLDRTLKIMEAEDSKPAPANESPPLGTAERREYSNINTAAECEKANLEFRRIMLEAQGR